MRLHLLEQSHEFQEDRSLDCVVNITQLIEIKVTHNNTMGFAQTIVIKVHPGIHLYNQLYQLDDGKERQ